MRLDFRTKTELVYIANDGTEFHDKGSCLRYEDEALIKEAKRYFESNAIAVYGDCKDEDGYHGFPGYEGVGGNDAILIRVDDTVLKFIRYIKDVAPHVSIDTGLMEDLKGEVVLFSYPYFEALDEWYFVDSVEGAICEMRETLNWLCDL